MASSQLREIIPGHLQRLKDFASRPPPEGYHIPTISAENLSLIDEEAREFYGRQDAERKSGNPAYFHQESMVLFDWLVRSKHGIPFEPLNAVIFGLHDRVENDRAVTALLNEIERMQLAGSGSQADKLHILINKLEETRGSLYYYLSDSLEKIIGEGISERVVSVIRGLTRYSEWLKFEESASYVAGYEEPVVAALMLQARLSDRAVNNIEVGKTANGLELYLQEQFGEYASQPLEMLTGEAMSWKGLSPCDLAYNASKTLITLATCNGLLNEHWKLFREPEAWASMEFMNVARQYVVAAAVCSTGAVLRQAGDDHNTQGKIEIVNLAEAVSWLRKRHENEDFNPSHVRSLYLCAEMVGEGLNSLLKNHNSRYAELPELYPPRSEVLSKLGKVIGG